MKLNINNTSFVLILFLKVVEKWKIIEKVDKIVYFGVLLIETTTFMGWMNYS